MLTHRYVLCFARSLNTPKPWIVLIEKNKPEWQAGKYNFPGGKIEEGESHVDAAIRELYEETGIIAQREYVKRAGTLLGDDFIVDVMDCPFRGSYELDEHECDEGRIMILPIAGALRSTRLIPNLRIMIPLLYAGQHGWEILYHDSHRQDICEVRL